MDKLGWFLLGGAVAYGLFGPNGIGAGVSFSAGAGLGGTSQGNRDDGTSFLGAQRPSNYDPLGTVGGAPGPSFGEGAYIGFGGSGTLGGGVTYAYPPQSQQTTLSPTGVLNLPAQSGGACMNGSCR